GDGLVGVTSSKLAAKFSCAAQISRTDRGDRGPWHEVQVMSEQPGDGSRSEDSPTYLARGSVVFVQAHGSPSGVRSERASPVQSARRSWSGNAGRPSPRRDRWRSPTRWRAGSIVMRASSVANRGSMPRAQRHPERSPSAETRGSRTGAAHWGTGDTAT